MRDNRRFGRGGTYVCHCCGKRTRETGAGESGLDLCRACMEEAEMENAHSDGYHVDEPDPNCPDCGFDEEAV